MGSSEAGSQPARCPPELLLLCCKEFLCRAGPEELTPCFVSRVKRMRVLPPAVGRCLNTAPLPLPCPSFSIADSDRT